MFIFFHIYILYIIVFSAIHTGQNNPSGCMANLRYPAWNMCLAIKYPCKVFLAGRYVLASYPIFYEARTDEDINMYSYIIAIIFMSIYIYIYYKNLKTHMTYIATCTNDLPAMTRAQRRSCTSRLWASNVMAHMIFCLVMVNMVNRMPHINRVS
jgi:Ca2+/H+ antiporter